MAAFLPALAKGYLGNQIKNYATSKFENAVGLPKDSIALATNPVGFAGKVIKDVAKDYGKQAFFGRNEIPVEDRTPSPAGDIGSAPSIEDMEYEGDYEQAGMRRGGKVKSKVKSKVSKASSRGDGIAQRGKTKGRYI
tara:strand:+ start:26 stop:436 length:411 start_codon:yes stop_codon:yes gene_type:complete